MSDAERRPVTAQARRCMNDSWEECAEALSVESRPMSKAERQKLTHHIFAACPEMQFLDVLELFSTPTKSTFGIRKLNVFGPDFWMEFVLT